MASVLQAGSTRAAPAPRSGQTLRTLLVEPDHPVPQRLTVHAADLRGFLARTAVEHCRDRQKPACLTGILSPLRKPPNFAARISGEANSEPCGANTSFRPPRFRIKIGTRTVRMWPSLLILAFDITLLPALA